MYTTRTIHAALILVLVGPTLISGCTELTRGPAVPSALADRAIVSGMPAIRSWEDQLSDVFFNELRAGASRELDVLRAAGHTGRLPTAEYLAISGGGANGAYGAGVLCGWTDAGTRPTFKVVTGISTGALTAPFAFLGPTYDQKLRDLYTGIRTSDILDPRNLLAALFGDALASNAPLVRLLKRVVDEKMLRAIAAEYEKGRILLVGTSDLDAQRGVVWNVTAIAASGDPHALDLVHKILTASAAIPAAFPPVMIDVEVNGRRYQEMHVDGGAVAQVFFYPPSMSLSSETTHIDRDRRLFVIRNAGLDPRWAGVQRRTLAIASRAIDSLIQTQGMGDLYRIYMTSMRDGIDFNLTYIPPDFKEKEKEPFDPEYMKKLFDVGYAAAKSGRVWSKMPPGMLPLNEPPRAAGSR